MQAEFLNDRKLAEFKDDGYYIFPGLLPSRETQSLRDCIYGSAHEKLVILGSDVLGDFPDVLLPLVTSPRVLDLTELIVGPSLQLDSISLVSVPAGSPLGISWHRDPYGCVPVGTEFQRPLAFNLLIYLQDLTNETGPLRVIPGSHRRGLTMDRDKRSHPYAGEHVLYCRSGDAVLLHNNVVHSRSQNFSSTSRIHISVVYSLSCLRSRFTDSPTAAAIRSLLPSTTPPRIRRLFGDDPYYDERYNSGFMDEDSSMRRQWMAEDLQSRKVGDQRTCNLDQAHRPGI